MLFVILDRVLPEHTTLDVRIQLRNTVVIGYYQNTTIIYDDTAENVVSL